MGIPGLFHHLWILIHSIVLGQLLSEKSSELFVCVKHGLRRNVFDIST